MYHVFVRRRISYLFERINKGDFEPILSSLADSFEHVFLGHHALGGRRTRIESVRKWYERLFRLLPDIQFEIHGIGIAGPPWNTLAYIEWSERNTGTDGILTRNNGYHIVHLAWGKMKRLHIVTDTVELTKTLSRLASSGVTEASAPAIIDTK